MLCFSCSQPVSLPPNLRRQGPPVLKEPADVLPLSQYQHIPNYQPNISLAPPSGNKDDQQTPPPSSCLLQQQTEVSVDDNPHRQTYSGDKLQNLTGVNSSNRKGYTISLCPTNYSNSSAKSSSSAQNSSNVSPCDRTIHSVDVTEASATTRTKGGSLITSKDLQIITVDPSSVPKDLQIIKLDSSVRSARGVTVEQWELSPPSTLSKELKIIKLGPQESSRKQASKTQVSPGK